MKCLALDRVNHRITWVLLTLLLALPFRCANTIHLHIHEPYRSSFSKGSDAKFSVSKPFSGRSPVVSGCFCQRDLHLLRDAIATCSSS